MTLEQLRSNRGMTQQALAEAIGWSHTNISALEHGKRSISGLTMATAIKLSKALHITLDELSRVKQP